MLIFLNTICKGQDDFYNKVINETPNAFIAIGFGINHTGVLSVGADIPITDKLSAFCDLGAGGWGIKFGIGANYYFKNIRDGSALSLGFYRASGSADQTIAILNEAGDEIPVFLDPVGILNATYSYNLKIGKKHKLALIAGYAVAITNKNEAYETNVLNPPFDDFSKRFISFLHPDGPTLGVKLMFGIGNR